MTSSVRVLILIGFAVIGAYGLAELRGPQGLPALKEKWTEIRQFEEENANLQRENDYRRDRIKKVESSPSAQEVEIRKKIKLLRAAQTCGAGCFVSRLKLERDDLADLSRIQILDFFE